MIITISFLVLMSGIILYAIGESNWDDGLSVCGYFFIGFGIINLLTSGFIAISAYGNADAEKAELQETYKTLIYKIESGIYQDESGFLDKEIIDEIQIWNKSLVYNQKKTHNIWTGNFLPDIYDDFETIDYNDCTQYSQEQQKELLEYYRLKEKYGD